jgi:adenine-specific DNA-methyltransferase
MPRKPKSTPAAPNPGEAIASIKYPAKCKNLPPAGLEAQGVLQEAPRLRYEYNLHLPPVLRSASVAATPSSQGLDAASTDQIPELLAAARQRALTDGEARTLADALRRHEPWLEWSGKREKPWFDVEPVALHMHERVSTQAILRMLAREQHLTREPEISKVRK